MKGYLCPQEGEEQFLRKNFRGARFQWRGSSSSNHGSDKLPQQSPRLQKIESSAEEQQREEEEQTMNVHSVYANSAKKSAQKVPRGYCGAKMGSALHKLSGVASSISGIADVSRPT